LKVFGVVQISFSTKNIRIFALKKYHFKRFQEALEAKVQKRLRIFSKRFQKNPKARYPVIYKREGSRKF
jgi:hypothetical protein